MSLDRPSLHGGPAPPLALTTDAQQLLRDAAYAFLGEGVLDCEEFLHLQQQSEDRALPPHKWKLVRERAGMRVFFQKNFDDTDEIPLGTTALLGVGSLHGSASDCLYSLFTPTREDLLVKHAYDQSRIREGAILAVLETPTAADPFRSMCLRHTIRTAPTVFRPFYKGSDQVSIEAIGKSTFSTGEPIAYHLEHSIELPQVPPSSKYYRLNLSVVTIWSPGKHEGETNVFTKLFANLSGGLEWLGPTIIRMGSDGLLMSANYAHFGHLKKLTRMLRDATAKRREQRRMRLATGRSRACSTSGRRACAACGAKLHALLSLHNHRCALCRVPVCSSCRVKQTIQRMNSSGVVRAHTVCLCPTCWQSVISADADAIARREASHQVKLVVTDEEEHPIAIPWPTHQPAIATDSSEAWITSDESLSASEHRSETETDV